MTRLSLMNSLTTWGWKRRAVNILARAHVLRPAISLYQTALGVRAAIGSQTRQSPEGPPVPPSQMRVRVGPALADLDTFLRTGELHARLISEMIECYGSTPETSAPILDFGCGCGRVARHWHGRDVGLHGCDVNERMIEWCRHNLIGEFEVNRLQPPLPYADDTFGLAYAFSVFTHLPEPLQHWWLREFQRILRPGGYLIFSTFDEYYMQLNRLTQAEQVAFDEGKLIVLFEAYAGESFCSAYHPRQYVEQTLARGFDYLCLRKGDSVETHDLHLLRKPKSTGISYSV